MSGVSTLIIENAGLTEVPNGTFNLPSLDQLDLRNNRITELPTDLLEVAPDRADGFVLGGNTFSPETIALLVPYYNRTGVDFGIPEVRQRAQLSPTSSTDVSRRRNRTIKATQPRSDGTDDNSNGLLLRRWLRSSRGVAPKKLR